MRLADLNHKIGAALARHVLYPVGKKLGWKQVRFPAFGEWLYIAPRSILLRRLVEEGAYEATNVSIIKALLPRGGTFYDVGANYGIVSLAIATARPDCSVLSLEPAAACVAGLQQTIATMKRARWEARLVAVGDHDGEADFLTSTNGEDAYGGLADTGRMAGPKTRQKVPLRTLDTLWQERDREPVHFIKIDVEGFEASVLQGATELLREQRPPILLELSRLNMQASGVSAGQMFDLINGHRYRLLDATTMVEVADADALFHHMLISEDYVLIPR